MLAGVSGIHTTDPKPERDTNTATKLAKIAAGQGTVCSGSERFGAWGWGLSLGK